MLELSTGVGETSGSGTIYSIYNERLVNRSKMTKQITNTGAGEMYTSKHKWSLILSSTLGHSDVIVMSP